LFANYYSSNSLISAEESFNWLDHFSSQVNLHDKTVTMNALQ